MSGARVRVRVQTFFTKVEHQGLRLSAAKLLSALVQREVHKVWRHTCVTVVAEWPRCPRVTFVAVPAASSQRGQHASRAMCAVCSRLARHQRIVEKRGMIAALITLLQSDDVLQTRVAQLMDLLSRQGPTHVGYA